MLRRIALVAVVIAIVQSRIDAMGVRSGARWRMLRVGRWSCAGKTVWRSNVCQAPCHGPKVALRRRKPTNSRRNSSCLPSVAATTRSRGRQKIKGISLRDHSGVRVDEAAFCTQRMRSGMRVILYSDERVMFKVTRMSWSWSFEKISRRSRRRAVEVAQVQVGRGGTLIFPWQGRQTSTSFSPFLRYH